MSDSLIVNVIRRYFRDWDPPRDTGRTWISCKCPWHGDNSASASISFELDAFKCHACPVRGDAIKIIRQQEGADYPTAVRLATELSVGGHSPIQTNSARKSSRRTPASQRSTPGGGDRTVLPWLR